MKYIHSYDLDSLHFSRQILPCAIGIDISELCTFLLYYLKIILGQMYTFAMDTLFQIFISMFDFT